MQQQQQGQVQQQNPFFRKFNNMNQGGQPKMANPAPGEVVPSKVFVGGLPHGCREEHLMEAFQLFGNIVQIDCKHEKGFGFVHFENQESVQSVMSQAGAIVVGGQLVGCKPADNRQPKLALMEQQQMQEQQMLQQQQMS
jgi:RNA recognition motif-containing protein